MCHPSCYINEQFDDLAGYLKHNARKLINGSKTRLNIENETTPTMCISSTCKYLEKGGDTAFDRKREALAGGCHRSTAAYGHSACSTRISRPPFSYNWTAVYIKPPVVAINKPTSHAPVSGLRAADSLGIHHSELRLPARASGLPGC
jgi:hypothetical protein